MSALVPTTSNSFGAIFDGGIDGIIYSYLDDTDLHAVENSSKDCKKEVNKYYLDAQRQFPDLCKKGRSYEALANRSILRILETERLCGGRLALSQASKFGGASLLHPKSQLWLSDARWNCKAVGLVAILQGIPAARAMLKEVAQIGSNKLKFRAMKDWMEKHPEDVASLKMRSAIRYKNKDLGGVVYPLFANMGPKVLNFLPGRIGSFPGMEHLILDDNRLVKLPAKLPPNLKTLSLKRNHISELTFPLPSLNALYLNENSERFTFEQIDRFVREYIQNGGKSLRIFLDKEYFDMSYESLIADVAETHEVTIELRPDEMVLTVSKILDPTQPLTQP